MEGKEEREKVLVPVHHRKPAQEEELLEEPPEEPNELKRVWETPRRWRVS